MPALMIASYIEASNTRIGKLVLCAKHYIIRSGEMKIRVLSRGHLPSDESSDEGHVVFFCNTTFQAFFRIKAHAKLMTWDKEDRKQDHMLRHTTDGSQ
jgi:hypothetical protein